MIFAWKILHVSITYELNVGIFAINEIYKHTILRLFIQIFASVEFASHNMVLKILLQLSNILSRKSYLLAGNKSFTECAILLSIDSFFLVKERLVDFPELMILFV